MVLAAHLASLEMGAVEYAEEFTVNSSHCPSI